MLFYSGFPDRHSRPAFGGTYASGNPDHNFTFQVQPHVPTQLHNSGGRPFSFFTNLFCLNNASPYVIQPQTKHCRIEFIG